MTLKIDIISDVHLDLLEDQEINGFFETLEKCRGSDTLFIAGDLAEAVDYRYGRWLERFSLLYKNVYYVPGNHDFFNSTIEASKERIGELTSKHYINFVEPGKVFKLGKYKVMGGTCWYNDTGLFTRFIDYRMIKDGINDIRREFHDFCDLVLPQIDENTIVLSHHFPTSEFIDDQYEGMESNIYFCAYLENKIQKSPHLWLFGHTHAPFDKMSELGFRGVCNPLGYRYEGLNPHFWDRLTIELP